MSGGWNPTLHLACHINGRPTWRDDIAAFVPRPGMVPGMEVAGAANGAFSTASALSEGAAAAGRALQAMGRPVPVIDLPPADGGATRQSAFWQVTPVGGGAKDRAWLDFANDVTAKDVRQATQEGYRSVEHLSLIHI